MERITAKRRYGARMGTEGFVPPNDVALYLAAWYHKVGRDEEAHEAVKAHIQDALVILSDDDPSNDMEGYFNLSRALLAIGDERNAVAIFNAIRPYKNGLAVIEKPEGEDEESEDEDGSESSEEEGGGDNESGDDEDEEEEDAWFCDGICGEEWNHCDGMIVCRYCSLDFCSDCHKLLLDGELPINVCGSKHSFLTVPTLSQDQVFKEGELSVEGKIVHSEKFKADLKKQYGL